MTSSPSPSLLIHTLNSPKSLKPTSHGDAADAIHQTLHFALDGQSDDWHLSPSEWQAQQEEQQRDCGGAGASSSSSFHTNVKAGFLPQPLPDHAQTRPYISYLTGPDNSLHIPHPFTIPDPIRTDPCAEQDRDRFDVTVKFFFQGGDDDDDDGSTRPEEDVAALEEALATFRRNTGLLTVDTLLLSWPSGVVHQWTEAELDRGTSTSTSSRILDRVRTVWQTISASPYVGSLGLCDLPVSFLEALFPTSSTSPSSSSSDLLSPSPPTVPSEFRLPRVISLSSSQRGSSSPLCDSHEKVLAWCKTWAWQTQTSSSATSNEHVEILSHSDPHDMLPQQSLPSLLREFQGRIPIPVQGSTGNDMQAASKQWAESLRTQWLLKYTVLISDRGLLADAGYLVRAGEQTGRSSSS